MEHPAPRRTSAAIPVVLIRCIPYHLWTNLITPILLAAGASSRMGRPKALLDFDGRTCLELALGAVGGLGPPVVVLGPHREAVLSRLPLDGVEIAVNDHVASGQTESLKKGLERLPREASAFLFYPVDHPLVSRAEVTRLVEAYRSGSPEKSLFVPSHGGRRGHPVLGRRELAPEFLALPPGTSARAVLGARPERIEYVLFDEAYILMDMDTPEDYARCLKAYRERARRKG
jgi:CTP:molybdopterin cytidylyltransferase MocA